MGLPNDCCRTFLPTDVARPRRAHPPFREQTTEIDQTIDVAAFGSPPVRGFRSLEIPPPLKQDARRWGIFRVIDSVARRFGVSRVVSRVASHLSDFRNNSAHVRGGPADRLEQIA
jgi:hypothetical protein